MTKGRKTLSRDQKIKSEHLYPFFDIKIKKGGKYFFTRNETSIMAFEVGANFDANNCMFTCIGAHTDSPCLRVKAVSAYRKGDFLVLNTQPYGGGLW